MGENLAGRGGGSDDRDPGSDLDRLVDLEARIAADLARAESVAAAILDEARQAVRNAGELQAGLVEKELAVLRETLESEYRRQVEAIEEEANRQVERLDRAGAERLDLLATRVLERIVAPVPTDARPGDREGDDDHRVKP